MDYDSVIARPKRTLRIIERVLKCTDDDSDRI